MLVHWRCFTHGSSVYLWPKYYFEWVVVFKSRRTISVRLYISRISRIFSAAEYFLLVLMYFYSDLIVATRTNHVIQTWHLMFLFVLSTDWLIVWDLQKWKLCAAVMNLKLTWKMYFFFVLFAELKWDFGKDSSQIFINENSLMFDYSRTVVYKCISKVLNQPAVIRFSITACKHTNYALLSRDRCETTESTTLVSA